MKPTKKQYSEMCNLITEHRKAYAAGNPAISDEQYDLLFRELITIEARWPELCSDSSPTKTLAPPPMDKTLWAKHLVPMFGLDNAFTLTDIDNYLKWIFANIPIEALAHHCNHFPADQQKLFVVEPKLDGIACDLIYENGNLVGAITRGDGEVGTNILQQTIGVNYLQRTLSWDTSSILYGYRKDKSDILLVRGELVVSRKNFDMLNNALPEGVKKYSTPRPLVMALLAKPKIGSKLIDFVAYKMRGLNLRDMAISSHTEAMDFLRISGFKVAGDTKHVDGKTVPKVFGRYTLQGVVELFSRADLLEYRDNLEYLVDGLVLKTDSVMVESLIEDDKSVDSNRRPKWSIAWKFSSGLIETQVINVDTFVGRSGRVTPVAVIQPISVEGVTIDRVTMSNFRIVADEDIRVGDTVAIVYIGFTIPEIRHVVLSKRPSNAIKIVPPKVCQVCGEPLLLKDSGMLFCVNNSCPARMKMQLLYAASRFKILGFGPAMVELMWNAGIRTIRDLITTDPQKMVSLMGANGEKIARLCDVLVTNYTLAADRAVGSNNPGNREIFNKCFDRWMQALPVTIPRKQRAFLIKNPQVFGALFSRSNISKYNLSGAAWTEIIKWSLIDSELDEAERLGITLFGDSFGKILEYEPVGTGLSRTGFAYSEKKSNAVENDLDDVPF